MGVSSIAVYGEDLAVAYACDAPGEGCRRHYQAEFDQAFRFAARYAGHHTDPGVCARGVDRVPPKRQELVAIRIQCARDRRYITLLNPEDTVALDARKDGVPAPVMPNKTVAREYTIGPYNQRFGAWARSIPVGKTAELKLDSAFLANLTAIREGKLMSPT